MTDFEESKNLDFDWVQANDDAGYKRCLDIRLAVFTNEQNVPWEFELEHEEECQNYLLMKNGNEAATARFWKTGGEWKIERVAVMKEYRGCRVGILLISKLIGEIKKVRGNGKEAIVAHAQVHALNFWKKCGFVEHGEEFDDCGIQHLHMTFDESNGS